jgi:hypothetical protein
VKPAELAAYDTHYQLLQQLVDAAAAVAALPLELMASTCDRVLLTGIWYGRTGPVPVPSGQLALQRAIIDAARGFRSAVAAADATAATASGSPT